LVGKGERVLMSCPDCSGGYRTERRTVTRTDKDGKKVTETENVQTPCPTCDSSGQILGPPA
jgi:hypothetical protein